MYAETHTHKRIDKSAKKCTQNIFVRMLQQHVLWNTLEAEHSSLVGWESWWKRWQKQRKAKQINDIAPKREKKYVQKNMIDSGWQCWWGQYEMRANVREGDNLVPKHFFLILILLWELLPSTERGGSSNSIRLLVVSARTLALTHTLAQYVHFIYITRKSLFSFHVIQLILLSSKLVPLLPSSVSFLCCPPSPPLSFLLFARPPSLSSDKEKERKFRT